MCADAFGKRKHADQTDTSSISIFLFHNLLYVYMCIDFDIYMFTDMLLTSVQMALSELLQNLAVLSTGKESLQCRVFPPEGNGCLDGNYSDFTLSLIRKLISSDRKNGPKTTWR